MPFEKLLDEDGPIPFQGLFDAAGEGCSSRTSVTPMLDPSRGGFVKKGNPKWSRRVSITPSRSLSPCLLPDEDAVGNADSRRLEDPLLDVLVHAEGRGEDAGSRVGNPEEFQKSLDAAVLPVFPVERDEGEVDLLLQPFVGDPPRLFLEPLGDVRRRVLGDELPGDHPEPPLAVHEDRPGDRTPPGRGCRRRFCRC